jgi:hypothetical protein
MTTDKEERIAISTLRNTILAAWAEMADVFHDRCKSYIIDKYQLKEDKANYIVFEAIRLCNATTDNKGRIVLADGKRRPLVAGMLNY